jgi:hypothetical protein
VTLSDIRREYRGEALSEVDSDADPFASSPAGSNRCVGLEFDPDGDDGWRP